MHTWLPDAHSEAPAPVSAMLSGALLVEPRSTRSCASSRSQWRRRQRSFAEHVLIVFGAISLVAASLFVLRQRNYKRLLAYSSIEHMGVIALGIGFGAPLAVAGALLHVLTHAAAKGLAFFGSRIAAARLRHQGGRRDHRRRARDAVERARCSSPRRWRCAAFRCRACSAASSRSSPAASPKPQYVGVTHPAGVRQRGVLRRAVARRRAWC